MTFKPTAMRYIEGVEDYQFQVMQVFWGSIDLKLTGHPNYLVFRKSGTLANPMFVISFTAHNSIETKKRIIHFKAENILQVMFTDKIPWEGRACVVVLRLLNPAFAIMKAELPTEYAEWEEMLKNGKTHCKFFSDNLIFVTDPLHVKYVNPNGHKIFNDWPACIDRHFYEISCHWSQYLLITINHHERDESYMDKYLTIRLLEQNFRNFYSSFGLKMKKFKYLNLTYIGFACVPVGEITKYRGCESRSVSPEKECRLLKHEREIGMRAKPMYEARRRQREQESMERKEKAAMAKKTKKSKAGPSE